MTVTVTEVLNGLGLITRPPAISDGHWQFVLSRGAAIHEATAFIDREILDWNSIDERIKPHLDAYMQFRALFRPKWIAIEEIVKHGALDYCGHVDRVGHIPDLAGEHLCVVEIKTNVAPLSTKLQTMAYAGAWRYAHPPSKPRARIRRYALVLRSEGWRVVPYKHDKKDWDAWRACLSLCRWLKSHGRWPLTKGEIHEKDIGEYLL